MDVAERKYRNYVIAAAVGGFLFPWRGMVGALLFYSRGDREGSDGSSGPRSPASWRT